MTLRVALALLLAAVARQEAQQVGSMRSAVRVERVLVDAYVTTGSGEAIEALYEARVNVFTLDISGADTHTLEVRLMQVADLAGGRYEKTHIFTGGALSRVVRSLGGRYVLVFVKPEGPRGIHPLSVQLAGRKGDVVARAYYQD